MSLIGVAVVAGSSTHVLSARQARVASERPTGPVVDFIAAQADGTPMLDLRASEVEVRINGRLRLLRSLRLSTAAPAPGAAASGMGGAPPPYGTNAGVIVGRRFALIIDEESFVAGREQLLRNAVDGLIERMTPADQILIVGLPFGGIKVPFTSDTARVRRAMDGVAAQGTRNETGSELACRTRRFLESLDGFLEAQAGGASPLTVILFTAGLAAPRRDAAMTKLPGMCELLPDHFRVITAAAGAAHANFYVVQPADIGMNASGWKDNIAGSTSLGSDNPLEGIEHLAGVTGGTRLPLDAGGTGSLLRVARETSAFWNAELEPDPGDASKQRRTLDVRVARRGVTVRARPEIAFAETSRATSTTRPTVANLLVSRDAFAELQLRVGAFSMREADGRLRVGIVVEPADAGVSFDSVGAVLIEDDSRVVARWFASDATLRPLLGAMVVPAGSYRLRVAAIDKSGRIGVAEDAIEASLTTVGPLSLGSMMLGVARESGVGVRLEFGSEPTAIASFDIYGGKGGERMTATLEVALSLGGPAVVSIPLVLTRAGDTRVVATGSVPLGALPPGDYVIRGTIGLDDGTTGRVVRTLRKVKK